MAMNGGLGNILGGCNNNCNHGPQPYYQQPVVMPMCSENTPVNRFELGQEQKIAQLESQIALRDANTYMLQQISATKEYLEGKIDANYKEQACINTKQAVHNAQNTAALECLAGEERRLAALVNSFTTPIVEERYVKNTCCNAVTE